MIILVKINNKSHNDRFVLLDNIVLDNELLILKINAEIERKLVIFPKKL